MNRASFDNVDKHHKDVITDGLVECVDWHAPWEGPYTRIAKLALVNVLSASNICQLLFGKKLLPSQAHLLHGRSLLDGSWMERGGPIHGLGKTIRNSATDIHCTRWLTWIASDSHLRYCSECLKAGFQTAFFQIDALHECPVHGTEIIDYCRKCGHKTPPYALTEESFKLPLKCSQCFSPYSLDDSGESIFSRWSQFPDQKPFHEIHDWLVKVEESDIEWPDLDIWAPESGAEAWRVDKRLAVFATLASLYKFPEFFHTLAPSLRVKIGSCGESEQSNLDSKQASLEENSRTSVYESIRRKTYRSLGNNFCGGGDSWSEHYMLDNHLEAIAPVTTRPDSHEHGLLMWRNRFEEGFIKNSTYTWSCSPQIRARLRSKILNWPLYWRTDTTTWGHFTYLCLLESLWIAKCWQQEARTLFAPSSIDWYKLQSSEQVALLELYSQWLPKLSAKLHDWPMSIAAFRWRPDQGPAYLVTVSVDHLRPYTSPAVVVGSQLIAASRVNGKASE